MKVFFTENYIQKKGTVNLLRQPLFSLLRFIDSYASPHHTGLLISPSIFVEVYLITKSLQLVDI